MTRRPFHRKIGGIHWFSIGPWRIAISRVKPKPAKLPHISAGPQIA